MSAAPLELSGWLALATEGLPAEIRMRVQMELTAHYDDALDELMARGVERDEARYRVLEQLGDPRLTARSLRHTHLAHRRYGRATVVGFASFLSFVAGALFTVQPILFSALGIGTLVYMLTTFNHLLESQPETPRIKWCVALVHVGVLAAAGAGSVGWFNSMDYLPAFVLTDPFVMSGWGLELQPLTSIHVLLAVGLVSAGLGWILISERLIDHGDALFRVGLLLRLFMFINGLALAGTGFALLLRNVDALYMATIIVCVTGVGRQALFTLIFFRAASRRGEYPQHGLRA